MFISYFIMLLKLNRNMKYLKDNFWYVFIIFLKCKGFLIVN